MRVSGTTAPARNGFKRPVRARKNSAKDARVTVLPPVPPPGSRYVSGTGNGITSLDYFCFICAVIVLGKTGLLVDACVTHIKRTVIDFMSVCAEK